MKKNYYILVLFIVLAMTACGIKKDEHKVTSDSNGSIAKEEKSETIENKDKINETELDKNKSKDETGTKDQSKTVIEKEKQSKKEGEKESGIIADLEDNYMTYDDLLSLDITPIITEPADDLCMEIHDYFKLKNENGVSLSAVYAKVTDTHYYVNVKNKAAWIIEAEITDTSETFNYLDLKKGDTIKIMDKYNDGVGLSFKDNEDVKKLIDDGTTKITLDGEEYYELDLNKKYDYKLITFDFIYNFVLCDKNVEYAFILGKYMGDDKVNQDYYYDKCAYPLDNDNLEKINKAFVKSNVNIYSYYGPQLVDLVKESK